MRKPWPAVIVQLARAGYLATDFKRDGPAVRLTLDGTLRERLDVDARFLHDPIFKANHVRDVGTPARGYRALRGTFGPGTVQVVVNSETGAAYADIDSWNPAEDVVGAVGHLVEVVSGWWRRG